MRRVVRPLACLLLAAAAGCSADSPGDGMPGADAAVGGPTVDGGGGTPRADAGPDGCLDQVPDDWGDNGPLAESQFAYEGDYTYFADMVPDTERFQRLFIGLHPDMGVFTGGAVAPGSYVLEGAETDYAWCGACVYLAVDDDGSAPSVLYMAQTGKLTVDSVAGGEIHGTLESAELTQIDLSFSGPSCADYQEGDPWPCGNGACSGENDLCEAQDLVPACTTTFGRFEF